MKRRDFLGIAASSIFAPVFGRWYRQGSGLLVREEGVWTTDLIPAPAGWEWDEKSGAIWQRQDVPGKDAFFISASWNYEAFVHSDGAFVRVL